MQVKPHWSFSRATNLSLEHHRGSFTNFIKGLRPNFQSQRSASASWLYCYYRSPGILACSNGHSLSSRPVKLLHQGVASFHLPCAADLSPRIVRKGDNHISNLQSVRGVLFKSTHNPKTFYLQANIFAYLIKRGAWKSSILNQRTVYYQSSDITLKKRVFNSLRKNNLMVLFHRVS